MGNAHRVEIESSPLEEPQKTNSTSPSQFEISVPGPMTGTPEKLLQHMNTRDLLCEHTLLASCQLGPDTCVR